MNLITQIIKTKLLQKTSLGSVCFNAGIFLLPSSAFLSGLFLLIALIFGSSFDRKLSYWKDAWNYPFLIISVFMIISAIGAYSGWLAWIGLANWLPLFWGFWGFQPYLFTAHARTRCAFLLVTGTLPVVITGLGQIWFGWQGPWELFNGLIVWFVSPGGNPIGRLSGLFDYANIAGSWLAIIWPFCLAALLQPFSNIRKRIFFFVFSIGIVTSLVLTQSRNAWGGLVISIPFVLGPASWFWLLPILVLTLFPILFAVFPLFGSEIQQLARKIVPDDIWIRLSDLKYMENRTLSATRIGQWGVALQLILESPWLGWGAAAFSVIYPLRTGLWHGHAHNLPLEMAVSHGLPVAILLVVTVISLLIITLRKGVLVASRSIQNNLTNTMIFDRAWWSASFVMVFLHASDIPLFDSRLNIVGWILLAGLRCIILQRNSLFQS